MSGFYGGAPGKDFLISQTFDSLDELKSAASEKHRDVVAGDYVLIYKIEDENNGELWLRLARPDEPLYKNFYKEIIKVTETFGYGLVGNLSGPRGFTPYIGENEHWWIAGVDTNKPSRGTGVKKINAAPRQFTAEEWTTHGALGHHEAWDTSSYDNSHILPKDTAYLTGTVTDAFDSEGEPIEAALFLVVTDVSASTITGDSVFVLKGSHGSVEPLDEKTATTLTGILEARDGTLHVATSIPTDLIAKNTKEQDGIVPAPTSAHGNSLWATDGEGNPSWQNLGFQNAEQVKSIVDKAIAESGHAVFKKVDKVPESAEAEDNVLYLVFNNRTKHYDIYAKIGSEVLLIDDTTVDLSNYASLQDLAKKVDKVDGKQLSTNDYTTEEKTKLSGIATGAQVNVIEKVKVNGTPLVPDAQKAVDVKAYNEDNKPEVGGRNLLLESNIIYTNDEYSIATYKISEFRKPVEGETVTFTVKGKFKDSAIRIMFYNSDGDTKIAEISLGENKEGVFSKTCKWRVLSSTNTMVYVYVFSKEESGGFSTIEWIKLERGEIATDWTPAPEDLEAEIPTKTSELINNSGFITQADIPEGAVASNTVPKAPAAAGSVGNELAFARGDHVHPMQTYLPFYSSDISEEQLNNKEAFPVLSMTPFWLSGSVSGNPTPGDGGTILNIRGPGPINAIQLFFGDDREQGLYVRRSNSYSNIGFTDWVKLAEIKDITASNFSGVLPVDKGGTGNTYGHPYEFFDDAYVDGGSTAMATAGAEIKNTANGNNLLAATGVYADKYSVRAFLGVGESSYDLGNNIAIQQNATDKSIIGTYKDHEIATLSDYATSSKAGLVKPGTNCSVTNDGTLNVTVPEVNVPTKVSQLQNDSGFLTKYLGYSGSALVFGSPTTSAPQINIGTDGTSSPNLQITQFGKGSGGLKIVSQLRLYNGVVQEEAKYIVRSDYATSSLGGTVKVGSGLSISSGTLSTTAEPYNGPTFSQAYSRILVVDHICLPANLATGYIRICGFNILTGVNSYFDATQSVFFSDSSNTWVHTNPSGPWADGGGIYIHTLSTYGPLNGNKGYFAVSVTIPSNQQNGSAKWSNATELASYLYQPENATLQASGCLCIY